MGAIYRMAYRCLAGDSATASQRSLGLGHGLLPARQRYRAGRERHPVRTSRSAKRMGPNSLARVGTSLLPGGGPCVNALQLPMRRFKSMWRSMPSRPVSIALQRDAGRHIPSRKLRGNEVPPSTHEMYVTSGSGARKLFATTIWCGRRRAPPVYAADGSGDASVGSMTPGRCLQQRHPVRRQLRQMSASTNIVG
jgi:hypothetical protein